MGAIFVINPNSTLAITAGLDRALDALRSGDGAEITCLTLVEGPPGIETAEHISAVEAPLLELARAKQGSASAFVIACFSDPGLAALRRNIARPVLGIARCGLFTACSLAERIGVISIAEDSIARHRQLYMELGMAGRVAGDRQLGMQVTELVDNPAAQERILATGQDLVADGAGAIVLGCTAMAAYRGILEEGLGLPVIDPTLAAVAMARTFCA